MTLQRINGNWERCLSQFGKQKPANTAQLMKDRIERGVNDKEHFNSGAWTAENFNIVNGRIYGARASFNPLIPYAKQAVQAHKAGEEFYLTSKIVDSKGKPYSQLLVEIADKDSKKPLERQRVADLGKVTTVAVPTDSFADDDTIVFLAEGKKPAEWYGLFLKNELSFDSVKVYHTPLSKKDLARGHWLDRLDRGGGSYFGCFLCYYRGLGDDNCSLFRVSTKGAEQTAVGSSKKISKPEVRIPTLREVQNFAKPYISQRDREEFETGLQELFQRNN